MRFIAQIMIISFLLTSCGDSGDNSGGTYTLSWQIPTSRANGDPLALSEISGYEACYTINNGVEQCIVFEVFDSSQNSYKFDNLAPGEYSITLAIIDTNNLYSDRSQALLYKVR